MATAVALNPCSSVLRGRSRSSEQSLSSSSSSQGPNSSLSSRSLKITPKAGRTHGRRRCLWRAQPGATATATATATAEAAAAAAAGLEQPTYGRQFFPLAAVVGQEEAKLEEQRKQQPFVGKGFQRSKRFPVSQGRRVQTLSGYTAMIVMYTRTGRYKEAEKMVEEMDFHGVVPDEANWLARLSAYGQQGKI